MSDAEMIKYYNEYEDRSKNKVEKSNIVNGDEFSRKWGTIPTEQKEFAYKALQMKGINNPSMFDMFNYMKEQNIQPHPAGMPPAMPVKEPAGMEGLTAPSLTPETPKAEPLNVPKPNPHAEVDKLYPKPTQYPNMADSKVKEAKLKEAHSAVDDIYKASLNAYLEKQQIKGGEVKIKEAGPDYKPKDNYYKQPLPFAQIKRPVKKKPDNVQKTIDESYETFRKKPLQQRTDADWKRAYNEHLEHEDTREEPEMETRQDSSGIYYVDPYAKTKKTSALNHEGRHKEQMNNVSPEEQFDTQSAMGKAWKPWKQWHDEQEAAKNGKDKKKDEKSDKKKKPVKKV